MWVALRRTDQMNSLPKNAGISLKPQHYDELLDEKYSTGWLEIHPENYMGRGGAPHAYLRKIREKYNLSMHGVGMSIGSSSGLDSKHLSRLKELVDHYQPDQISEHLSWSHWNSIFLNDLLPLPYTEESLIIVCDNIDKVQSVLGRTILVENPSTYIDFKNSDFSEPDFFRAVTKRSGCGVLLDINNVFVSAYNNGFDPYLYLDNFPENSVDEIHLAGHSLKPLTETSKIRIDDHGSEVKDEVWELFRYFLTREGRSIPTLIEWDTDVPSLEVLLQEASKANDNMRATLSAKKNVAL